MSRRLSKLFEILETASTFGIKRASSNQILQHYQSHPADLESICTLIGQCLCSKSAETRQVAALLLEQISRLYTPQSPNPTFLPEEANYELFSFGNPTLAHILERGKPLLASAGREFDLELAQDTLSPKERIAIQRRQLKERLGFVDESMVGDLVADEDLVSSPTPALNSPTPASTPSIDLEKLSARERAQLKRKGRMSTPASKQPEKKLKAPAVAAEIEEQSLQWPFFVLCEMLLQNIFNPHWHVRQGACLGLKAFFGAVEGVPDRLVEFSRVYSQIWIKNSCKGGEDDFVQDLLVRLNFLMALDRFTDFVQSQTSIVVREVCAQAIGAICYAISYQRSDILQGEIDQLTVLTLPSMEWQVRLSGLLGLKNIFAFLKQRPLLSSAVELNEACLSSLFDALKSPDEDVMAFACDIFVTLLDWNTKLVVSRGDIFSTLVTFIQGHLEVEDSEIESSVALSPAIHLIGLLWKEYGSWPLLVQLSPLCRHSNTSIREVMVHIFMNLLDSDDNLDQLKIWLFEFLILEENSRLKAQVLDSCKRLKWDFEFIQAHFWPILTTPLKSPFRKECFCTLSRFSLDLFFKGSDMLLHTEDFLLSSRMMVYQALANVEFNQPLDSFYASSQSPMHRISLVALALYREVTSDPCLNSLLALLKIGYSKQSPSNLKSSYLDNTLATLECCLLYREEKYCNATCLKLLMNGLKNEKNIHLASLYAATVASVLVDTKNGKLFLFLCSLFEAAEGEALGADLCISTLCSMEQESGLLSFVKESISKGSEDIGNILCATASLFRHSKNLQGEDLLFFTPLLNSPVAPVRQGTCKAFSMLSPLHYPFLIEQIILPRASPAQMESIVRLISLILERDSFINEDCIAYSLFFFVPVLDALNHAIEAIRESAYQCFSILLSHVSLLNWKDEVDYFRGASLSTGQPLQSLAKEKWAFLEQLFDLKKIALQPLSLGFDLQGVCLRPYQEDGIKWLLFLQKYSLNGALCDDMGLGKTLQTLVALKYSHDHTVDCATSLIVCPTSLLGHWESEITRYFPSKLSCVIYAGSPGERKKRKNLFSRVDIVITSYDLLRNDLEVFQNLNFNYCILDEGHVIKNAKTKISQAVKSIICKHRLLLSGTPIQNNVLELWSLFDFLMPGFLGGESEFSSKFTRIIQACRDAKGMSKEFELAERALDSLHKQTLPFILRRLKEDVLQDLPPKIIQDYLIAMSSEQQRIYQDYTLALGDIGGAGERKGLFGALQFLSKLCIHPMLVDKGSCDISRLTLEDSPKLVALRDILLGDCQVGTPLEALDKDPHRVLIFAQHKGTLDIIQSVLLTPHLPLVPILRIDGGTEAMERFQIATNFNSDPTIRILLLTTTVGGLGLNLTGADTVIFFEHDWNPMKDLQAMDRVHRLGQKRTVNVYRLIMEDTIEEKILSSQKFKLHVANSVINQQNVAISSMAGADGEEFDVAELFGRSRTSDDQADKKDSGKNGKITLKELLEQLSEEPE